MFQVDLLKLLIGFVYAKVKQPLYQQIQFTKGKWYRFYGQFIYNNSCEITFAHTSFRWANLASHNAGVTVVIVGIGRSSKSKKSLYEEDTNGQVSQREGDIISPYLTIGTSVIVKNLVKFCLVFPKWNLAINLAMVVIYYCMSLK